MALLECAHRKYYADYHIYATSMFTFIVLSNEDEISLLVLSGPVTDMSRHILPKWASSVFTKVPFFTSQTNIYFLTPAH